MAFAMPPPLLPHQYAMPQTQNIPSNYYNNVYPQAQPPQYGQPQQYSNYLPHISPTQNISSPISAPPTPTTVSPNSQILLHKKGRVAKTLYTPAVLRPTENFKVKKTSALPLNGNNPITPPGSLQSSLDSLDKNSQKQSLLSRRNTGDSAKAGLSLETVSSHQSENLWQGDPEAPGYGRVTGFPMTEHWKADSTVTTCGDPLCNRTFTIFTRKHHCRRCGNIFCASHSSNLLPLDQDAEYHPHGNRVRGCDTCWSEYTRWDRERLDELRAHREVMRRGGDEPSSPASIASPQTVIGISVEGTRKRPGGGLLRQIPPFSGPPPAQIAASVPGNHCWSTF